MFAVVENVCSMEDGMLYQRSAKIRLGLQLLIRLATLVLVWYFLWTTVSSYQAMASFYSWVSFPLPDAFYLPGSFASAGIVISSVILAYNSKKRTNGAFRPMQEPDNPKELGAAAKGKRAEPSRSVLITSLIVLFKCSRITGRSLGRA